MAKTILVVDDAGSFRVVVKLALQKAGFEVAEAVDGLDALAKLASIKPVLVVCDLNMPRLDGLSFVRKLKALPEHRFTPVVILTTSTDEAQRAEGRAIGVRAWVVKPFQPAQLLDVVAKLCP